MHVDISRRTRLRVVCTLCQSSSVWAPHQLVVAVVSCACGGTYDIFVGAERLDLIGCKETGRYQIPEVRDLGMGKDRVYGRWMAINDARGLGIYLSCPVCGGINNLSDICVGVFGNCQCFHCRECGVDLYVMLSNWGPYASFARNLSGILQKE